MRWHVNDRDAPKLRLCVQRWVKLQPDEAQDQWPFTEYRSSHFPKETRSSQDVTEVQTTDPYTPGPLQQLRVHVAPVLPPSLPAHTHESFQSLWKWFILPSSVFTFWKTPLTAGDASSATTLHSRGVFSSPMAGSRTSAVAKLTFLCYICHIFYSICCSWNKTSHQMLPWELSLKGEKVTEGNLGRSPAPESHVVSIRAPLDRGSKRAKTVENCLIAKICR